MLALLPSAVVVSTSTSRSDMTRSTAFPNTKCPRRRAMILRIGSTSERTCTVPTAAATVDKPSIVEECIDGSYMATVE